MGTDRFVRLKYWVIAATLLSAIGLAHPAQAQGSVSAGQTVSGRLDASDYILARPGTYYDDWFYEGRAGERVTVTQASTEFASWVVIGRIKNGELIAEKYTERGSDNQARMIHDLPADGRYVIRVSAMERGRTGAYTLRVDRAGTTSTSSTVTISPGSTVRGSLQASDAQRGGWYQDAYTFTGSKGDLVQVDMISSDFDPYLYLYWGSDVVTSDDDGGDGLNARVLHVLTENGTYTIYARSRHANRTGSYTLSFRSVAEQSRSRPFPGGGLSLNQMVTGQLEASDSSFFAGSYYDMWRFSAQAAQTLRITLRSSNFEPLVMVGTMSGSAFEPIRVADHFASAGVAALEFTFPAAGVYAIRVGARLGGVGRYSLIVESR